METQGRHIYGSFCGRDQDPKADKSHFLPNLWTLAGRLYYVKYPGQAHPPHLKTIFPPLARANAAILRERYDVISLVSLYYVQLIEN